MPESKDTNPKDAIGIKKAGLQCVSGHVMMRLARVSGGVAKLPFHVLFEIGLAMTEGARKYGRHNYRVAGVRASVYYDALLRHLIQWWTGEDIDKDSGVHHLVKAMACIAVVMDSEMMGNWVDDRPPKHPTLLHMSDSHECHEVSSEYFSRIFQQLVIWWEGGSSDDLARVLASLVNLRYLILTSSLQDDRPIQQAVDPHFLGGLNKIAAEIVEKYLNSLPPYTEKEHGENHEEKD